MCTPNVLYSAMFPGLSCPDDNMQHFTVNCFTSNLDHKGMDSRLVVADLSYEANVHFNYNEIGEVVSIDVCLIAPMPDSPDDKPIPYVVTDLGKQAVELKGKKYRFAPPSPKK